MMPMFDDQQLEQSLGELLHGVSGGLAVALAVGLGALHALGPGHGKALLASYLAGTRGRPRHAVGVGAIVAFMHTAVVLVAGYLLWRADRAVLGSHVEAISRATAAGIISLLGISLLRRELRRRETQRTRGSSTPPSAVGSRQRDSTRHEQIRRHEHDHVLPSGTSPLSWPGLVAIASSGGLVPSPAAVIVVLGAVAVGRAGFGLLLVVAFGLGLGITLTCLGLLVLWGRGRLRTLRGRPRVWQLTEALPLVSALLVCLGGFGLLLNSALATST